jgi:hypothetical protein
MIAVEHMFTTRTAIDLPSQSLGAALLDSSHHLAMSGGHASPIFLAILFSVALKDLRYL